MYLTKLYIKFHVYVHDYNLLKYTIRHLHKWEEKGPAFEAHTGVDEFIAKYKNYGFTVNQYTEET